MSLKSIIKTIYFIFLTLFYLSPWLEAKAINLRVGLFSAIPDPDKDNHARLCRRIEQEFNAEHADIKLTVQMVPIDALYEAKELQKLLKQFDLMEVDSVMMADLFEGDMVGEWPKHLFDEDKFHKATVFTCKRSGLPHIYAIPHWLCSTFLSHDESCQSATAMAIDLAGTWNLSTMYFASYASLAHKSRKPYETSVVATWEQWKSESTNFQFAYSEIAVENLANLAADSHPHGKDGNPWENPALNGDFHDDPWKAVLQFSRGEVRAFGGYGESFSVLHAVAPERLQTSTVQSIPFAKTLAQRGAPLVYVDQFILPKKSSPEKIEAAERFVKYMNSPITLRWIALGEDTETQIPRYLMPASLESFLLLKDENDHYKIFYEAVVHKSAIPFPPMSKHAAKCLSDAVKAKLMPPSLERNL